MKAERNPPGLATERVEAKAGGPFAHSDDTSGLARRRDAALRLPPLDGGHRDTWYPRELSEHETRRLCNQLAADGFDLGYLETRFGIVARRSA